MQQASTTMQGERPNSAAQGGFTLIEVLVAIAILALLSLMSWRGLDGMMRSQALAREHTDHVLSLQSGLGQWQADLDAISHAIPGVNMMDWDGRTLRLTRRSIQAQGEVLQVVAWSQRNEGQQGQWLRWQSAPLLTFGQWRSAWQQAGQWAQAPDAALRQNETLILPLTQWQLFYYRENAWSHPLSSTENRTPGMPDGVRLVLDLPPQGPLRGTLTRDWVRPTLGGNKS